MIDIRLLFTLIVVVLITGCSDDSDMLPTGPDGDNPLAEFEVPNIIPDGSEQYLNLKSDFVYDDDELRTYEFLLPQSSLSAINADPTAEQYVEGSLVFEGDTISPVGIRYKGSVGAFVGCTSGPDFANPSGVKICTKLSMKVKINWEGRDEKFYGLKKLQFHSQNLNKSQLRERLGYWLFRQMGVPAPRSVHARLLINGEYSGLYALTEQIDGRFTRENFDNGKGNLYKEVWPIDDRGNVQSDSYFLDGLKTNEDDGPSFEMMRGFAQDIASASTSQLKSVVEKWMDPEEIIKYAVVDRVIRHDDGPFHWYCGGGRCTNHNFYWYEEPTTQKLHLITWDLDNAFENISFDANPVTPIADPWGVVSNECEPFSYGSFRAVQKSATCDKLTAAWVQYDEEFQNYKSYFINGPLSEESVNPMIDKWTNQIRSATQEAQDLHADALTIANWEAAIALLKIQLSAARGM